MKRFLLAAIAALALLCPAWAEPNRIGPSGGRPLVWFGPWPQGTPPGAYNSGGGGGGGTNFGVSTAIVSGGAGGLATALSSGGTANTRYFVTANDTETAALSITAANVTVECPFGVVIQFTGATNGFNISGNGDWVYGCTLDHNSQSGSGTGPLVNVTGNDDKITYVNFQNTGTTNPSTGTIYQTAGQHLVVDHVTFLGSQTDVCVGIVPAASTTVQDSQVSFLQATNFAPATTMGCIYMNPQNAGAVMLRLHIVDDNIRLNSSTSTGVYYSAGASEDATGLARGGNLFARIHVHLNTSDAGSGGPRLMKLYGVSHSILDDIDVDDEGHVLGGACLDLGDFYDSTISNIHLNCQNGNNSAGFAITDGSRNVISNVVVYGQFGSTNCGFILTTIGQTASQNTVTGVTVNLTGTSHGICLSTSSSSGVASNNRFSNIVALQGASSSTESDGVNVSAAASSTVDNNTFNDITIRNFNGTNDKGLKISTVTTNTVVDQMTMEGVTALVSDSGTASRILTHRLQTTGTLSGGTLAVTFSGIDPWTGATTYICNGSDQTTPANAVSFTYTSGTAMTITGTTTDVIRYQCWGY